MAASDVEEQEINRPGADDVCEGARDGPPNGGLRTPGTAPDAGYGATPHHPPATKPRHSSTFRRLRSRHGVWGGARWLMIQGRARLRRELRARGGFSPRGVGILSPPGEGRTTRAVLAWWGLQLSLALWRLRELEQPRLWLIALGVGVLGGYAAVLFVWVLDLIHGVLFGADEAMMADAVASAPWLLVLGAPIVGGLIVGLLLKYGGGDPTPLGVADVIEARALGQGRIDARRASASVAASALSLGFGASAGREGPAVLAGATIASAISNVFGVRSGMQARTIMACAVAAAVSASFNAPIAGALFALEVVLGHYAVRAFAPITIASVAGAIVSRTHFGDNPAFLMPAAEFGSYSQLPAFAILGLVSAAAAATMMGAIFLGRDLFDAARIRLGAPDWTQPALAGAVLGVIFLAFPHAAAVGYQTTSEALGGSISLWGCVLLALVKILAVGVTLGGRFAGGVFSPALMV
ncbi:MAG: chloride channel protein, partial [Rhodobacteraceae bacterium]|nr:chloride channel protein [Paracoccaceae bacterium]